MTRTTHRLLFLSMLCACGAPDATTDDTQDDPPGDDGDTDDDDPSLDCSNDVDSHTSNKAVAIEDGDVVEGILCEGELGTDIYRFVLTKPRMEIVTQWEGDADVDVDYVFADGSTVLYTADDGTNPERISLEPGDFAVGLEYYIAVRRVTGGETPYELSLVLQDW